ncbi:MAG: preprotein translocase subunit YajC [Candidatus Aminicenantes bacterium]|nr:preprotein translocase subunit YajC [Candidatus Aminicenantes bacterium]
MTLFNLLGLQAQPAPSSAATPTTQGAAAGGSSLMMFVMMFGIFIIFYLLLIMPARKKQKKHMEMVGNLKSGDRIVTTGGIYGTVMGFKSADKLEVKIASNTVIQITKSAVGVILPKAEKGD